MSGSVERNVRRPLRTMPWWVAVIGAVAVVVSATITTLWLLSIAGHDAQLRIEAIKVGLSVGAGTGGAVALLLAVRRQWLSERAQAHAEDVARDSAYDATQRRVTELYGKAVEQLGHVNAAVRLGGLYSLERLAQDHDEHRQTVVDVLCAYLRMPFQPPSSSPADDQQPSPSESAGERSPAAVHDDSEVRQELQVRLAAQRLLARHLAAPDASDNNAADQPFTTEAIYWGGMRIDLTGAHLVNFNFVNCRLHQAEFRTARFSGEAGFGGARFSGDAGFGGAQFSGDAGFGGAQFSGDAVFNEAQFSGDAGFGGARFSGVAGFGGARFGRVAVFNEAQFSGDARFGRAQFSGDTRFNKAQFSGVARFGGAQFNRDAGFGGAQFSGDAVFNEAQFSGLGWFRWAQFGGVAGFGEAQFSRDAVFKEAQFSGDAVFKEAQFRGGARFEGAQFDVHADFTDATASHPNDEHSWPEHWQVKPSSTGMAPLIRP